MSAVNPLRSKPLGTFSLAALAAALLLVGCGGGIGAGGPQDGAPRAPSSEESPSSRAIGGDENPAGLGQWFAFGDRGLARVTEVEPTEGTYPLARVPRLSFASSTEERLEEAGIPTDARPYLIRWEFRFSQAFLDDLAAADTTLPAPFFVEVEGTPGEDEANERVAECGDVDPPDDPVAFADASTDDVFTREQCRFVAEDERLRLFHQTYGVTHEAVYSLDGVVSAPEEAAAPEQVLSSDPADDVLDGGEPSTIAVAASYSCALDGRGTISCWGATPEQEPPAGEFVSLESAPHGGMCTLDPAGSLACWAGDTPGPNAFTQTGAPPAGEHTRLGRPGCAISAGGGVDCWHLRPASVPDPSGRFEAVATDGGDVYCGVRSDRSLECWASERDAEDEAARPPSGRFTDLAGGLDHFCAVDEDASIECWGSGAPDPSELPVGRVASVSLDRDVGCALGRNERLSCWGLDLLQDPPDGEFTSVAVGTFHACAMDASGQPVCWGDDSQGQASPPTNQGKDQR